MIVIGLFQKESMICANVHLIDGENGNEESCIDNNRCSADSFVHNSGIA